MTSRLWQSLMLLYASVFFCSQAWSAYPEKPVRLIVPYAAGGPTDTFARALAEVWGKTLGAVMIVENKAGGGTIVGTELVARSAPDGYMVLMATVALAVNSSLHQNLTFDPVADLQPVGLAAKAPLVLVVNKQVPATTLGEFFDYLKASPGKISYGSAGVGSAPHLGGALLNYEGHFSTVHVPYRGSAPAMADLIGGHVQFMLDSAPTGLAQVNAGTVRLLGTTMAQRIPQAPDTPAIAEVIPGFEAYTWNAMLVAAKTPAPVVEKLRSSLETALRDPGLKKQADEMGLILEGAPSPAALAEFIDAEMKKWRNVVNASDMKAN